MKEFLKSWLTDENGQKLPMKEVVLYGVLFPLFLFAMILVANWIEQNVYQ